MIKKILMAAVSVSTTLAASASLAATYRITAVTDMENSFFETDGVELPAGVNSLRFSFLQLLETPELPFSSVARDYSGISRAKFETFPNDPYVRFLEVSGFLGRVTGGDTAFYRPNSFYTTDYINYGIDWGSGGIDYVGESRWYFTYLGDEYAVDGTERTNVSFSSFDIAQVPLPAAFPMLLAGIGGLGFIGRRRRKAKLTS